MQMNLITQLTAAPPSQPAASNDAPKEKNDRFSKLLSDADARGNNDQKQQSLKSNESGTAAINAQEVNPEKPATAVAAPSSESKILSTVVTPEDAKAMLAKLEAMNSNGEHSNDPAFQQLKEALEQIEASGEATDVAGMLEVLPEVVEAKPEERAPVLQRLMGWVSAAMDKKEAPANTMPDGTVQSLQASLFSAGDDAARAAAEAAAQAAADSKKKHDAEATAAVAVIVPTAQTGVMPEWVRKLGEGEENVAAEAINEAIPSLAMPEEEEGLPVVSLPGSEDYVGTKLDKQGPVKDFEALLKQVPLQGNDNIEQADVPVEAPNSVAALPNAPSVHNTSTLNPITVSANTHLATHTAAAEQVHVAITTMKDEGLNSITLQLEPADLGRVEIKMDTVEGKTNIAFLVDKPETLDALSRDARSLERMLQEAGVRADAGGMQFNLRQQSQEQAGNDDGKGRKGGKGAAGDIEEVASTAGAVTKHYTLNVKDGVDIHA